MRGLARGIKTGWDTRGQWVAIVRNVGDGVKLNRPISGERFQKRAAPAMRAGFTARAVHPTQSPRFACKELLLTMFHKCFAVRSGHVIRHSSRQKAVHTRD